ncbi:anti-sigma factor RsbA family regulatory protein [Nakamurella sp. GG22]
MKRFACRDVIPGCQYVFTGDDDQSVLDQVIAHAAADHGLLKPPLALVELVVATTYTVPPTRSRNHLRLVGATSDEPDESPGTPGATGDDPAAEAADDDRSTMPAALHSGSPGAHSAGAGSGFPDRSASVLPFRGLRSATPSAGADGDTARAGRHASATHHPSAGHDSYRHECLFYDGVEEFVEAVRPFVLDGLALHQPVMVAVVEPRASALRAALGPDAERVVFADMASLAANPARIIPAWQIFADRARGPSRGVGEPIWAGRRPAEVLESQLHEALLNLAPAQSTPLWLVCPYDVGALDPLAIQEARRSHPTHTVGDGSVDNIAYGGVSRARDMFATRLPEPTGRVSTLSVGGDVAVHLLRHAAAAGLTARRSATLAAAVDALTSSASVRDVTVRVWREQSALMCQVDDPVVLDDPLVGRSTTMPTDGPERGIRLANELCDLVQVRSGASGTAVRLHSWL